MSVSPRRGLRLLIHENPTGLVKQQSCKSDPLLLADTQNPIPAVDLVSAPVSATPKGPPCQAGNLQAVATH